MARISLLFALLTCFTKVFGQAPVSSFTIKPSGCIEENLKVDNTSLGALTYQWDFCLDDIRHLASATIAASVSGLGSGSNYRVIKSGNQWVGFITSYETNSLSRINFNELGDVTSITNLGDLNGLIVEPYSIDVMFSNGEWYGFVGSLRSGQGVVKLKFGNSLANSPVASNIGSFGFTTSYLDLKLIRQSSDILLALIANGVTAGGDGSLVTVNFGTSLDNLPSGGDIFSTPVIDGVTTLRGFDLIKKGGNWFGLFSTTSGGRIITMKFGPNIQTAPLSNSSFVFGSIATPFDVKFVNEGAHYYAAIANLSIPVSIVDLGQLNGEIPVEIATAPLPTLFSLEVIRNRGKTIIQGSGLANEIQHIVFESPCSSSVLYSELEQPPIFQYTADGPREIELIAIGNENQQSVSSTSITISALASPDVEVTKDMVVCEVVPVTFNAVSLNSGDIVSYSWDYGDASVGSGQTSQHAYAPGSYNARVGVTGINGCVNFAEKSVVIFEKPEANFELPNTSTYCTNQLYSFANTSESDPTSPVTWSWLLNGEEVASTEEFSFTFTEIASQEIRLRASLPGCQSEKTEIIPGLTAGPTADFIVQGHCRDSEIFFTNTSSGLITGYEWTIEGENFGTTNASFVFASAGNKTVTLTALSASGCNNNTSKIVEVFSLAIVDFEAGTPPFSCNGVATPFTNNSQDPADSDITSFEWNFDDPGPFNTSVLQNPSHTFANAATYNVALAVTTDKGCVSSVVKPVTILPSPSIGFENGSSCLAKPTSFTALSNDAVQYYWEIGTSYYETKNTFHIFNSPGSHAVRLNVVGSNGCVSGLTRNIIVPVPVTPSFTVTNNCKDLETRFTSQSTGADPVVTRSWNFAGEGNSTDASPSYTFHSIGDKLITLQVITASGCSYQRQDLVNVIEAPTANFTFTPDFGVPPQEISFVNSSLHATSFAWSFDDGSFSTEISPEHTFTALGEYDVELTVSNSAACQASIIKVVSMVAPLPDVDLSLMTIAPNNDGTSKVIVTIANRGNTFLRDLPVRLDVSGKVTLETNVQESIAPFSMYNLILNFSIAENNALEFLCASTTLEGDLHPEGNRICHQLKSEVAILSPYPNPVKEALTVEWVAQENEEVRVQFVDTDGKSVIDFTGVSSAGLNQKMLDVTGLRSGIYILRIESPSRTKVHRVLVSN